MHKLTKALVDDLREVLTGFLMGAIVLMGGSLGLWLS